MYMTRGNEENIKSPIKGSVGQLTFKYKIPLAFSKLFILLLQPFLLYHRDDAQFPFFVDTIEYLQHTSSVTKC